MSELSFRTAELSDLDRLVAIHSSAYPSGRGHDERVRNLVANPLGPLDDLWVAQKDGAIVGHAFLFALQAWFGGVPVRVGGIATVAVAPEARGSGVATRLLDHLHDVATARGDVLTLLYPFRQGFYGRLGYAPTSPYRHLRFAPQALRAARSNLLLEAATGADREGMAACWEAAGRAGTGRLVRSEASWTARLSDERYTWLVARSGPVPIEGYVAWTLTQPDHGPTTLVVRELVARSHGAERALWGAIAAQRDQVAEVRVDVPEDDAIDRLLVDADRVSPGDALVPHALGELAMGPMARVTDPARALGARGFHGSASLTLEVEHERLALSVGDGRAVVNATTREADVRLDRVTLAAVAFGGLRVVHAARLGWLEAKDDRTLEEVDAILAVPPYFSSDRF